MSTPRPIVHHGDCLAVLRTLPDESVDAVVTDPPYGLSNTDPKHVAETLTKWVTGDHEYTPPVRSGGFMGAKWDAFVPPPAVWDECMRVLKPGGHLLVFAGTRTQDLMGLSIRLAGFELRDGIGWVHSQGFPKSMDVSKAIDKARDDRHDEALTVTVPLAAAMRAKGLTRRDLNIATGRGDNGAGSAQSWTTVVADGSHKPRVPTIEQWTILRDLLDIAHLDNEVWRLNGRKGTPGEAWDKREVVEERPAFGIGGQGTFNGHAEGATYKRVGASTQEKAERWAGWGTALKPAIEPVIVARKPLDGTVAANVLAHGTGGINVDATRVGTGGQLQWSKPRDMGYYGGSDVEGSEATTNTQGRFPPNVLLDPEAAAAMDEQSGVTGAKSRVGARSPKAAGTFGDYKGQPSALKDHDDTGGASRFFPVFKYQAKAPAKERPRIERTMLRLRADLTPAQVDHVRARLTEAGVQVD